MECTEQKIVIKDLVEALQKILIKIEVLQPGNNLLRSELILAVDHYVNASENSRYDILDRFIDFMNLATPDSSRLPRILNKLTGEKRIWDNHSKQSMAIQYARNTVKIKTHKITDEIFMELAINLGFKKGYVWKTPELQSTDLNPLDSASYKLWLKKIGATR